MTSAPAHLSVPSPAAAERRRSAPAVPPTTLLERPDFAVLPWLVLATALVAGATSEWLLDAGDDRQWLIIGSALTGAVLATALAVAQHLAGVARPRLSAWLYGVGTLLLIVGLAAIAITGNGLATPYFVGMFPLATYLAMIVPQHAQRWLLGALLAVTGAVQLANPTATLFDAVVVASLVLAGWACGVLGSLEHARLAKIGRRLASYDRTTRSLNRRAFLEQLDRALGSIDHETDPIAVLLVDLTNFRQVNVTQGDLAGDDLLTRVGATFASVLPADAELGRLGDDRFAVLLPSAPRSEAEAIGHRIRSFLHADIDAAVGIATCQVRTLTPDDLMRVAEAALRVCKEDGVGMHVLVGGSTSTAPTLRALPAGPPPLQYRQIRSTGKVPRAIGNLALYSWISTVSFGVVAGCGAVVIAVAWIGGGEGLAHDMVRFGGVPWLLWVGALTVLTRVPSFTRPGPRGWFLLANSLTSVTIGICTAALADGGMAAPLAGALFVKVLFDAATLPALAARVNFGGLLAGWLAFALFSPGESHYLAPYQLVLLGGCFVLGSIGQRANVEMAAHARSVEQTDDLTGLPNRAGFRVLAERAFLDAVTRTGSPYSVLWFRLDDPGQRIGNSLADRDRMLRMSAETLQCGLPDAYAIGRTGELEFVAAVPRSGRQEALATARLICDRVGPVPVARCGVAACPQDGATIDALLRSAAGLAPLAVHTGEPERRTPLRGYPGGPRADRRAGSRT